MAGAEDGAKASVSMTPVYGVMSDGPLCYIVELDGTTVLLDCGWREPFAMEDVEPLKK